MLSTHNPGSCVLAAICGNAQAHDTQAQVPDAPQGRPQLAAKRSTTVKDLAISSSRGRTLPQRRSLAPVTSV